jgi:transposase
MAFGTEVTFDAATHERGAGSAGRAAEMAALRDQGLHLEEIAERYSISRERVRQILKRYGGPDAKAAARARSRRERKLAEARVDELLALWRAGADPRTVAGDRGLHVAACRGTIERFATDGDHLARRASLAARRRTQVYSDRDIIRALTAAADVVGRVPSGREYAAVARDRGFPGLATVLNRMGGWTNAMTAAGFRPPAGTVRVHPRRWSEQACWDAVCRASADLCGVPSVRAYETYAAGRADLPSAATIRIRLGRWSVLAAGLAAERQVERNVPARPGPRPSLAVA